MPSSTPSFPRANAPRPSPRPSLSKRTAQKPFVTDRRGTRRPEVASNGLRGSGAFIHQRFQQRYQGALLGRRQPGERKSAIAHPLQQLRPEARTRRREMENLDPAIGHGRPPLDQAAMFEAID